MTEQNYPVRVQSLVLNALVDVVRGEQTVLEDAASTDVVREAFHDAVDVETVERFSASLERIDSTDQPDLDALDDTLFVDVVTTVCEQLASTDVSIGVEHVASHRVDSLDAALYNVLQTGDPDDLTPRLSDSSALDGLEEGVDRLVQGKTATAARVFERTLSETTDQDDEIALMVLAAWAHHRSGNDELAATYLQDELVEELVSSRCLLAAATSGSARRFHQGERESLAFVRHLGECPSGTTLAVQFGVEENETVEWTASSSGEYLPIRYFGENNYLRIRMEGSLTDFPELLGYYLAIGVVDPDNYTIEEVKHVLLSGPATAEMTETVYFDSR